VRCKSNKKYIKEKFFFTVLVEWFNECENKKVLNIQMKGLETKKLNNRKGHVTGDLII
jgi:hypothetical protein